MFIFYHKTSNGILYAKYFDDAKIPTNERFCNTLSVNLYIMSGEVNIKSVEIQACFSVLFPFFLAFKRASFHHSIKNLTGFICHKENSCNFIVDKHSEYYMSHFVFQHDKSTTIFYNHQIFRRLYFIKHTLYYSDTIGVHHYFYYICNRIKQKTT